MAKPSHEIQIFSRKPLFGRKQWYWRAIRYRGGKKVCGSLEGYNNLDDLGNTLQELMAGMQSANIVYVDDPYSK